MFSNYRLGAICFVGRKLNELEYSFEEGLQFPFNHFWHPEDFCSSLEEERSNFSAHSISITTMIMIFTTVCSNMKQSSAFFWLSIGHHKHSLTSLIFFLFVFLQSSQNPARRYWNLNSCYISHEQALSETFKHGSCSEGAAFRKKWSPDSYRGQLVIPCRPTCTRQYLCHSHAITLAVIPMQPHLFHVQKHGEEERGSVHL